MNSGMLLRYRANIISNDLARVDIL